MNKLRRKSIFIVILVYVSLVLGVCSEAFADRDIYVGDLISIKISKGDYTEDDLREDFKEFDVVEIEDKNDGYILVLRTFDTGIKSVTVGNTEVEITITSILKGENEELLDGKGDIITEKKHMGYWTGFIASGAVCILSFGILFLRRVRKKKEEKLTPYERLEKSLEGLDFKDEETLVMSTVEFKKFLENLFNFKIRGKTSSEIIHEIRDIKEIEESLSEVKTWFETCDGFKFSRNVSSIEEKEKLLRELRSLARRIQDSKEEVG